MTTPATALVVSDDDDEKYIPEWVQIICEKIACGELQCLHLDREGLYSSSARAVGLAICHTNLTQCRQLQELYLYDNHIGADGAVGLARELEYNTSITLVHMSRNQIGPVGATAMGNMLVKNYHLKEFFLRDNKIANRGIVGMAKRLEHNTSLEMLDLRNNTPKLALEEIAMEALTQMLKCNRTLKWLWLEGNDGMQNDWICNLVYNGLAYNYTLHGLDGLHPTDPQIMSEAHYYMQLNSAGRYLLRVQDEAHNVPTGLWPRVLARASHDVRLLYCFLSSQPSLIAQRMPEKENCDKVVNRKRRRKGNHGKTSKTKN